MSGMLIATRNYTIGQQCTTDSEGVTTCTMVLQSTAIRYYVSDVWSTRLVLDTTGNVLGRQAHLPFGEEFAESGTQEKHHFTSYEAQTESSTDYAVNRQYSQSVGRFASADPYEASSYLVNPQSWNRFSYVENDPIHNVDSLGLLRAYPEPGFDPCCSAGGCGDSTPSEPESETTGYWPGFNPVDYDSIAGASWEAYRLLLDSSCQDRLAAETPPRQDCQCLCPTRETLESTH